LDSGFFRVGSLDSRSLSDDAAAAVLFWQRADRHAMLIGLAGPGLDVPSKASPIGLALHSTRFDRAFQIECSREIIDV
jgi:hypothetical protein